MIHAKPEPERTTLEEIVAQKYFGACYAALTSAQRNDVAEHVTARFNQFSRSVLPWLKHHVCLQGHVIVEVGCGSGSSTQAILPEVLHAHCFDIHKPSLEIAEFRLRSQGHSNYTLYETAFNQHSLRDIGAIDGIFLAAVLEHTTFHECVEILSTAWQALRPGGWLCVIDTPNRLSPFDHHTSLLPFFSMLPPDVRLAYAPHSPRADFASSFASREDPREMKLESLARWGAGISYHEFEIALGSDVHQHIVATGYEQEIVDLIGITPEDTIAQHMLSLYAGHANRAFSRRALYVIFRKPG